MTTLPPIGKLVKNEKNDEKYFQTLYGHTLDSLRILREYIDKNFEVIEQFCDRWQIDRGLFLKNLFLMVYFHDIGKLTKEFQRNIRLGKHSSKYPHAFYSLYLLKDGVFSKTIIDIPLEKAAILGHHTQLYDQIYMDQESFEQPTFLVEEIQEFVNNIEKAYSLLGFERFFDLEEINIKIEEVRPKKKKLKKLRNSFVREINNYLKEKDRALKAKSIFTYIFSILQLCDDYASANFSEYIRKYSGTRRIFEEVLDNPQKYVLTLYVKDPTKTILGEKTPYKFQKELTKTSSKFTALFAPCGRGKTEGALLWAFNILKKHKRNKIIFAMPTQTTSNAMYDRLAKLFGNDYVGIYHGKSFIKLKEEIQKIKSDVEEEKDYAEIQSENFKGEVFFKPITITTIDHLIYSFIKGFPQADFACGNIQNAVIIFDEVHYYEKRTLEHLITLFKILKKMNIPHILMSGTFPDFMMRLLDNYNYVVDSEGLEYTPFKLEFYERNIFEEEVIEEIIENYKSGFKQFVILNTVERAKRFYSYLVAELQKISKNPNILLYHSQYTYKDRVEKEKEIYERIKNKPFVLIATQVIEISLDISADFLFSELAPPDALGQRAGRLNRGANWWEDKDAAHILKLYLPENSNPYKDELIKSTMITIQRYEGEMSYKKIKLLCDEVYHDYSLEVPSNLETYIRKEAIFGEKWIYIATGEEVGLKFKVRDEKIQYIDVIPHTLVERFGLENVAKIEYMAKVPFYYLKKDMEDGKGCFNYMELPKRRKNKVYWICRFPYSYEIGFNYNDFSKCLENII